MIERCMARLGARFSVCCGAGWALLSAGCGSDPPSGGEQPGAFGSAGTGASALGGSSATGGGTGGATAGAGSELGTGGLALAGAGGTGSTEPNPLRTDSVLADGWRFLRGDAAGAEAVGFADATWTSVSVPHTYNASDGQDGGGDYYRGVAWYRRNLAAPELEGRRAFLELGAASTVADVYLNGALLGSHRGGYSAFRFDVTDALVPGDNVLAVKVDNAPAADVAPLQADYTFFGGLYRDVRLSTTNALHIDRLDHAAPGVYLRTDDVSTTAAAVSARVRVTNSSPSDASTELSLVLLDATGAEAARFTASADVSAGATSEVVLAGTLANPHLWNGRQDPYLYSARVDVSQDGVVQDSLAQPLGIRRFAVDANGGFTLNGAALDLHGVNRHQDRLDRGWAIGTAEHDEDMAFIREIGATAVRLAHYQHAQYFYDLCDREGLVVWAEIPLVDAITNSTAFSDNARQQLTELIRQSYNHPSIAFWGFGNEQRTDDAATNALLADLAALVQSEDDTRLSTYAHCCNPDASALTAHGDLVGYNYYYGWYMGSFNDVGAWADALHAAQPGLRFSLSEYGAGASVSQHQDPPQQPATTAAFHPEEYQALLHEVTWQQLASRPYIWGKFVWNLFDFASDGRSEGDAPGRNDKGLVTYDRRTRKDAFYWYKASWSAEPLVYITSRRFEPRTTPSIDIKVYSNLARVGLTVNGASLPEQTASDHVFRWTAVPLQLGANAVEARASDASGGVTVTDSVTWTRQ
jgi:beta-galactosidase